MDVAFSDNFISRWENPVRERVHPIGLVDWLGKSDLIFVLEGWGGGGLGGKEEGREEAMRRN